MRLARVLFSTAFVSGLAILSGCWAETDRTLYAAGDAGVATFSNGSSDTLWFGGCHAFVQERWNGSDWVDEGPDWLCVWEGYATPLPPRESRSDGFRARTPGDWRLAYQVGHGCTPGQPLGQPSCKRIETVHSNAFQVATVSAAEQSCRDTGGVWDPLSCGHYDCGLRPLCQAVIPGCDCGHGSVFLDGLGCIAVPCGAPQDEG